MREITSRNNERVKFIKRLYRRRIREKEKLLLAEGVRVVEELVPTGQIEEVFFTDQLLETSRGQALLDSLREGGVTLYRCAPSVFAAISDTTNAQGVLAVAHQPPPGSPNELTAQGFVLILDEVQDPGNLGTILRTAAGAGIGGVLLTEGTVDPFSPKVVRSSMGALYKIPFRQVSVAESLDICRSYGLELLTTNVRGGQAHYSANLTKPSALVLGNEARGVNPLFEEAATARIYIPLTQAVESLNVAVACGILIFEAVRQRAC